MSRVYSRDHGDPSIVVLEVTGVIVPVGMKSGDSNNNMLNENSTVKLTVVLVQF